VSALDWLFVYVVIAGIWVIGNIGAACIYASYWRSQRERGYREDEAAESRRNFVRHLSLLGLSPIWVVPVLVWVCQWVAFAWRESSRAVHEEVIAEIAERNKEAKDLVVKGYSQDLDDRPY